jgi:chromosome partitioning protein
MKTITTINFKGGSGKTTVTWLLVKYLAKKLKKNVLIVDTDPQMSLTLAVQLEEDKGILNEKFGKWFYEHKNNQKTLMNLVENFEKNKSEQFNFTVNNIFTI